jgi:hypothetical protein
MIMAEPIDIVDIEAKRLYLAAQERERKAGTSMAEIIVGIVYGEDTRAALEAFRIYYSILYQSDLDTDLFEPQFSSVDVISLNTSNKQYDDEMEK